MKCWKPWQTKNCDNNPLHFHIQENNKDTDVRKRAKNVFTSFFCCFTLDEKRRVYHIERNALCIFFYCMRRLFGFDKIRLRVGKQRKKTIMSMEEKLEAELRVAPQDHAKWVQLGQAYFDTDFRKAHACFSRALALEPFNAQDRLNRGRKSLSMDAFEEALADFSLAVRLDPHDGFKWHYLGNACFFLERFDAAIACYMEAMKCH